MTRSFALAAFLGCTAALVSGAALVWPDCYCPIQVNDGTCFYTLDKAIAAAQNNDIINIYDDIVVYDEIPVSINLEFIGHGTPGPRMDASMNLPEGGMLRVTGHDQVIVLQNINFGRIGDGMASALRSISAGTAEYPSGPPNNYRLNLTVKDCTFKNFATLDRGGAAMFIAVSSALLIENSEFSDNINHRYVPLRWEGGGAIWIQATQGVTVIRNTKFLRNRSLWYHGQGGGFMINWLGHNFHMDGVTMEENHAPGGGAVFLGTISKNTVTTVNNCVFRNNNATEFGWGSRGGAMWTEYIHGKFLVRNSTFIGNHVDADRGGVFANNKVLGHGLISLSGTFVDNSCKKGGSIWDSLSARKDTATGKVFPAFRGGAKVVIVAGSVLKGNHVTDHTPDVIIRINQSLVRGIIYARRDQYTGETLTITNNIDNAANAPNDDSTEKPDPREAPKKA